MFLQIDNKYSESFLFFLIFLKLYYTLHTINYYPVLEYLKKNLILNVVNIKH